MNSYKEMYFYLFNRITDLEKQLREMQLKREEMYLLMGEPEPAVPAEEKPGESIAGNVPPEFMETDTAPGIPAW